MGSSSAEKVPLGNEAQVPETTIEIKIKTLDSQTYTMRVDKRMTVPALKEQIALVTGVLSEQQRLICRGKVLKDDQLLSAYHVEDGHTLHLVVRQPPQLSDINISNHPASDPASSINSGPSRRVSPSVVIETFNVPNQGEGVPPEFGRIVAAVLGSLGIPALGSDGEGNDVRAQGLQRHEGALDPTGVFEATLPQQQPEQASLRGQSERSQNAFGIPTSIHLGSANPPVIPDSLTTLSQYLSHVRREFDAIGRGLEHSNQAAPSAPSQTTTERGSNHASHSQNAVEGLPTPASLAEVMLSTRQMLVEQVGENLLQLTRQLENQVNVTDTLLRSSMQTSALRTGVLLHNLGAFLLELGRTTMTLRLGETPAEALVNAGPAVFISPSGPNPIMVQPFPFQPGTSFGSVPMGLMQPGSGLVNGLGVQRRIDIQIRRGSSAAMPNISREEPVDPQPPSERRNPASNAAGENLINQAAPSTNVRLLPVRTMASAVPGHLQSDSSVNSLGLYYPILGRFHHLASGPVSADQGSQASSEGQQPQNSYGAVGNGSNIRPQEASNAQSVSINILSPDGAPNNQEPERQVPGSVAQLLRALFPGGEIHVEEAGLQGQATEPNPENRGTSSSASVPVAAPEPRTSDEGLFLSNLLQQIMPLISHSAASELNTVPMEESSASEHRMDQQFPTQAGNSDAGASSQQSDPESNPPSSKRRKTE